MLIGTRKKQTTAHKQLGSVLFLNRPKKVDAEKVPLCKHKHYVIGKKSEHRIRIKFEKELDETFDLGKCVRLSESVTDSIQCAVVCICVTDDDNVVTVSVDNKQY